MNALSTPHVIGLVVGLVLLVSIRAVWRATMPPRWMKLRTARCEACGYAVEGLEKLRCPECGSDLREAGIITRAMEVKRRGSYGGAILGLTCIVSLLWVSLEFVVKEYAISHLSPPAQAPRRVLPDDGIVRATLIPVSRPSQPLKLYEYWDSEDEDDLFILGFAMADGEGRDWVLRLDRRDASCELWDPQGAIIHTA